MPVSATPSTVALLAGSAAAGSADGSDAPPLLWLTLSAIEPRELLRGVADSQLPKPFARYVAGAA
jgi:hypothetical protein